MLIAMLVGCYMLVFDTKNVLNQHLMMAGWLGIIVELVIRGN